MVNNRFMKHGNRPTYDTLLRIWRPQ